LPINIPEIPSLESLQPWEAVVGFLDILGMKDHVDRAFRRPRSGDYGRLVYTLVAFGVNADIANQSTASEREVRATVFSDCITFSAPFSSDGIARVLWRVAQLASLLLERGIYVRGGVAAGLLLHNESLILGPALVSAYELESQVAKTPRIVVAPAVVAAAEERSVCGHRRLFRDDDGEWVLDVFRELVISYGMPRSPGRESADPSRYEVVRGHLLRNLDDARSTGAEAIVSKLEALARSFNSAVERYLSGRVVPIPIDETA
jgi:hypothetical protein